MRCLSLVSFVWPWCVYVTQKITNSSPLSFNGKICYQANKYKKKPSNYTFLKLPKTCLPGKKNKKNKPHNVIVKQHCFKGSDMGSLRGHKQPGWVVQKLSTIQINLLRAPRCLDHPGVSGPEVRQGQPEADSELALSPVSPKVGCHLWLQFYVSLSVWCACLFGVAASRAEIVCHAFSAYLHLV